MMDICGIAIMASSVVGDHDNPENSVNIFCTDMRRYDYMQPHARAIISPGCEQVFAPPIVA